MQSDRRRGTFTDRVFLVSASIAGTLALSIQVGLAFITFSLMEDVRRMDDEHKHLLEKSTNALRACKQRQS